MVYYLRTSPHLFLSFYVRSMRAGNKKFNRGMRIDYCLISSPAHIVDAVLLDEDADLAPLSDHCPVGLSISSDFFHMQSK